RRSRSVAEALAPDRARRIHAQPQLRALVGLGHRIAADRARESALRADRAARGIDVLRRFVGAPLERIDRFELRHFAADHPEHGALRLRQEPQWSEAPGARRIEFE